ncbi:hypothetical protein [Endozoicomonas sp. ALB032]|uniref:hypothetical protein n=1 Tax=Endozoicomonas sp. ALB032 TaxID=3403082 RepID=UPI003BB6730D
MRLCICISGQARGQLESMNDLAKQLTQVPSNVEITCIFSLWKNASSKVEGPLDFPQLARIFERNLSFTIPTSFYHQNLWKELPKTYQRLKYNDLDVETTIRNLFPNSIIDIEDQILDLELPAHLNGRNSKKMLYKRWRANEIKKKIERDRNKQFDLVVVSRPDLNLKLNFSEIAKNNAVEGKIYLPLNSNHKNYTNDVMAYGSSKSIDIYTLLFYKSMLKEWRYIHNDLYFHLESNELEQVKPVAITPSGFENQKLISYDEIKGENKILDSIYNTMNESDFLSLNLPNEINNAWFIKSHINEIEKGEYYKALRFLLLADLSSAIYKRISVNRREYIIRQLKFLLSELKFSLNDLFEFLNSEKIMTDKILHNISEINL